MSAEFPRQNDAELIHAYIESELTREGINIHQISMDGAAAILITDKEVPGAIMSSIRQYAADKGTTIEFQIPDSGD